MRPRFLALITVIALCVPCIVPTSAAAAAPTALAQYPSTSFTPPAGSPTNGWYWMRSSDFTDVARWTFDFDPALLTTGVGGFVYLYLTPLVTQDTSGGAGWKSRVKVNVTYDAGGKSVTLKKSVNLVNPFPLLTTASSGGVGYQTFGTLKLTKSLFKNGAGTLTVEVMRDSAYKVAGYRPHVAVQATALAAYRYAAP